MRRFVHVSTIAVHSDSLVGIIDEQTPVRPGPGDYGPSKAEAERIVARAVRRGLPAITLRLANIYGPFGRTFTMDPIEALVAGRFLLIDGDRAPSNTVYVDDVAGAIARGLGPAGGRAIGETFCIGADDEMTWADFFRFYAAGLDVLLRSDGGHGSERWVAETSGRRPGWVSGLKEVLTSAEFRAFGRKILETDPHGRLPRWVLGSFPGIEHGLRRALGTDSRPIYRAPATAEIGSLVRRPRPVLVRSDKARRVLGYQADVPRAAPWN